jgi:hypothetical protein
MGTRVSDGPLAACAAAGFLLALVAGWSWFRERGAAEELRATVAGARDEARALAEERDRLRRAATADGAAALSRPAVGGAAPADATAAERARLGAENLRLAEAVAEAERAARDADRRATEAVAARAAAESRAAAADRLRADAERRAAAGPASGPDAPSAPSAAVGFAAAVAAATDAASVDEAAALLGRSSAWAPLVAARCKEPGAAGVRALRLFGALDRVGSAEFLRAVAESGRTDPQFTTVAGDVLCALYARESADVASALAAAASDGSPLPVRLAALAAAAACGPDDGGARLSAAVGRSEEERTFALAVLPGAGAAARRALFSAAVSADAPPDFRLAACAALLADAASDEAAVVAPAAVASPAAPALFAVREVSSAARPFVLAAFLDRAAEDVAARRHVARATGLPPDASLRDLVAAVYADRAAAAACLATARARRPAGPASPRELRELAAAPRPTDLRDLVSGLYLVDDAEAATLAGAVARLGHPGAVEHLRLALNADAVAVRVAAVEAAASVPELVDAVVARFADDETDVRFAAARAVRSAGIAVRPEIGVPLLATLPAGGLAESLLDAMARHPAPRETLAAILNAAAAGDVLAPAPAAATAAGLAGGIGFDFLAEFAAHPSTEARAAVVAELAARDPADLVRALGLFDRAAQDPEPLVRTHAARALGRVRDDLARVRLVQLGADASPWVREAAVVALRGHPATQVVPAARRALSDPDADVAAAARATLAAFGVAEDPARLVDDLADPWRAAQARAGLLALVGEFESPAEAARLVAERFGAPESRP